MGVTEVKAKVIGKKETREYTFVVGAPATCLGLPLEEIEVLGLRKTNGIIMAETDTGIEEIGSYFADGELRGQLFGAILVPTNSPILGHQLLQNLRYRVNPETQEIEKVPDGERHPPYL